MYSEKGTIYIVKGSLDHCVKRKISGKDANWQGCRFYFKEEKNMVVQHNLTAMNSNRMLNLTVKSQAKSTEKLSSGYKINRAADDAAGLSISEKMRKQIRGLTQASANAQDGISAVQTAEGALNEVQDMLQRMNELAVKSANGTNSTDDRTYIQNEIDQLVSEIDRVAETTKFNETYLLKGDSAAPKVKLATYVTPNGGGDPVLNDHGSVLENTDGKEGVLYDANGNWIAENDLLNHLDVDNSETTTDLYYYNAGTLTKIAAGSDYTSVTPLSDRIAVETTGTGMGALTLKLHVGADATANNQIAVKIDSLSAKSLGLMKGNNGTEALKVDGADDTNALSAIETIKAAIQKISTQRSALGAVQNRLDHTINNLDNVVENTTAAESQIRDTDMASEMVKYSNNNILAQAGQSMLAQSNQSNQGVLSLLS